jgi:hypothetical protein
MYHPVLVVGGQKYAVASLLGSDLAWRTTLHAFACPFASRVVTRDGGSNDRDLSMLLSSVDVGSMHRLTSVHDTCSSLTTCALGYEVSSTNVRVPCGD